MKKIISIIVIAALLAVGVFALTACNDKSAVKVINIRLTDEEYAFGVNKNDPELLAEVNSILAEILSDGTFDAIAEKYFGSGEPSPVTSATRDATKDQLIVVTNAEFAPFEYMVGNSYAGIDMELAKVIADRMNKELVIVNTEFDSVVTEVQEGNADIAMAGLTVSPDRAEQVNFSNSYYKASQVIIVKADDTTFDSCETAADVENVLKGLSNVKAGYQSGTTGDSYINGSDDLGFAGYKNITGSPYDNAAMAVEDMLNGNIAFVVVDEAPAKAIADSFNAK